MKFGFNDAPIPSNVYDASRLKLKKEQQARICCIDPDIFMCMFHRVNIAKNDKRNGKYECFGDYKVIFGTGPNDPGRGADPEKCPFCKVQAKLPSYDKENFISGIDLVTRNHGMNVISYLLDLRGQLRTPPAADCIAWIFNDKKLRRLKAINAEYGDKEHGLRVVDLLIKCENEDFQNFTIDPAKECAWRMHGQEFANQVIALWNEQKISEDGFMKLMANSVDKAMAERLIAEATGVGGPTASVSMPAPASTPAELQSLLSSSMPAPVAPIPQPTYVPPPVAAPPTATAVVPPPTATTAQPVAPVYVAPPPPPSAVIPPPPGAAVAPVAPAPPVAQPAPQIPATQSFEDLLKR